jgi:hypothetical protein
MTWSTCHRRRALISTRYYQPIVLDFEAELGHQHDVVAKRNGGFPVWIYAIVLLCFGHV